MTWDVLNVIGTIAFAISGAIVAMEEEYDIFGVYILGLSTAFGGGAIRNLLLGIPVSALWNQGSLFTVALFSMTIILVFPKLFIQHWKRWENLFDAIGLAAFAVQGALHAVILELPLSAAIVAAVLTGTGGGIIRDVLAGRKPLVFRSEIYAVWAVLAGVLIGSGLIASPYGYYAILVGIVVSRMVSVYFKWRLPIKTLQQQGYDKMTHRQ